MTWTSLLADLDVLVDRDPDTDDGWASGRIGVVERAERRISRELNLSCFHHNTTGTMTIGDNSVERPENVIAGVTFAITLPSDETKALKWRSLAWLQEWWPTPTATDEPIYIAVRSDDSFEVAPPPNLAYPWRYSFRKHAELLSDSNPSNNLTANYPDLLLYAAAVEAAVFAQEDRRDALGASYEARYQALKTAIAAAEQSLALPQYEMGDHVIQEPTRK
jgi:hypothetical protein